MGQVTVCKCPSQPPLDVLNKKCMACGLPRLRLVSDPPFTDPGSGSWITGLLAFASGTTPMGPEALDPSGSVASVGLVATATPLVVHEGSDLSIPATSKNWTAPRAIDRDDITRSVFPRVRS